MVDSTVASSQQTRTARSGGGTRTTRYVAPRSSRPALPLALTFDRWYKNPVTNSGGGAGVSGADRTRPRARRQIGRFSVRTNLRGGAVVVAALGMEAQQPRFRVPDMTRYRGTTVLQL